MTLFDGESRLGGSGDGDRSCRRRFLEEVGGGTREREGVVGPTEVAAGSVLRGFAGLGLGCMGVFRFEANGWRGPLGVTISTASMIILGRAGVVGLGGTDFGAGSSPSSSSSSSSITAGALFFVVRDCVVLADLEGPALAVVVRVVARVDALGGGLVEGGLVEGGLAEGGFFGGGFTWSVSSTTGSRTPGGLPRRLGASVASASVVGSASVGTVAVFLVARLVGALICLDGPATALDRVSRVADFLGSGGSEIPGSGSLIAAARRVVRVVARVLGSGFAGVTGPSDRSLRRAGSDGRVSAGAFRFGGIVRRVVVTCAFV